MCPGVNIVIFHHTLIVNGLVPLFSSTVPVHSAGENSLCLIILSLFRFVSALDLLER